MPRPPLFEWEGTEFLYERKTADWYWALGIIAAAAVIASILFGNILLALVIIAATASIALATAKHPRIHRFAITDQGLTIDDRLYPYDTMLHFSVLEYWDESFPPALSIKTRSLLSPHLMIPLIGVDDEAVYEYLSNHLEEGNHHQATIVERLVEMFEL